MFSNIPDQLVFSSCNMRRLPGILFRKIENFNTNLYLLLCKADLHIYRYRDLYVYYEKYETFINSVRPFRLVYN